MRTFLAAALLLATTPAFAQDKGPLCIPSGTLEQITKAGGAELAVTGLTVYQGKRIRMAIYVDKQGRWFHVYIGPDGIACFAGEGYDFATSIGEPA